MGEEAKGKKMHGLKVQKHIFTKNKNHHKFKCF